MDSVLIVKECLDSRIKSRVLGILYKLDIENAYEHVNWEFFFYLLRRCDFGERGRSWMRHCVSTVCFSIWVNGDLVGFFNSSKGLHQGNPLSPLLFVLIMEALNRMLSASVKGTFFSGYSMGDTNHDYHYFAFFFLQIIRCYNHFPFRKNNLKRDCPRCALTISQFCLIVGAFKEVKVTSNLKIFGLRLMALWNWLEVTHLMVPLVLLWLGN